MRRTKLRLPLLVLPIPQYGFGLVQRENQEAGDPLMTFYGQSCVSTLDSEVLSNSTRPVEDKLLDTDPGGSFSEYPVKKVVDSSLLGRTTAGRRSEGRSLLDWSTILPFEEHWTMP